MNSKKLHEEAVRAEIITAIKMYREKHGFSPTVRELCSMIEINSSSVMVKHLDALEDQGRITRKRTTPRTLQVTEEN